MRINQNNVKRKVFTIYGLSTHASQLLVPATILVKVVFVGSHEETGAFKFKIASSDHKDTE